MTMSEKAKKNQILPKNIPILLSKKLLKTLYLKILLKNVPILISKKLLKALMELNSRKRTL